MSKRAKNPSGSSAPISLEERYGSLFDNAGEGIFQTSVSGRVLNVNPALARLFGYRSPGEMKRNIKAAYRQIYADRSLREKILRRVEAEGHAKFEFRFLRKDKSKGWGYTSMHAVRNAQGNTAYYEGFFVDMTAHKELEEFLRGLTRVAPGSRFVEVAVPNNRVVLRYLSSDRRTERMSGGVPAGSCASRSASRAARVGSAPRAACFAPSSSAAGARPA